MVQSSKSWLSISIGPVWRAKPNTLLRPNMELCGGAQRPEGVKLGHPVLHTHDLQTVELSFVPASLQGKRLHFK